MKTYWIIYFWLSLCLFFSSCAGMLAVNAPEYYYVEVNTIPIFPDELPFNIPISGSQEKTERRLLFQVKKIETADSLRMVWLNTGITKNIRVLHNSQILGL